MHPSFRLFPALLVKISGHETHPSGLHKTQATAGFEQSLPSFLFCLRYSARQMGTPKTMRLPSLDGFKQMNLVFKPSKLWCGYLSKINPIPSR